MEIIIYLFICLNILFFFLIILIIFLYVSLYLIIAFQILDNINHNLKEKIGETSIKEIFRKKIDNLKLLLNFYENDIGEIIKDLNNIYNDFQDKYNLKIKGESKSKFLKKDGKNEMEDKNKNINCSSLISIFKKYNLFKYSQRRKLYFYNLYFIILFGICIYIIAFYNTWKYFKKDEILYFWVSSSHLLSIETNGLMNKFLLMLYNNQSFYGSPNSRDNILSVYTKLTEVYKAEKYANLLSDIVKVNEESINFDCEMFYKNLKNDYFEKLKSKFIKEENKLYNTMYIFCKLSNVMMFKDFKTVYLQLFSKVKNIVEHFQNGNYNYIIKFIQQYEIGKIQITFLFTYTYLMDYSFNTVKIVLSAMEKEYLKTIFLTGTSFMILQIFLLFIIKFVYIKNINNDCNKFLQERKVFKVCDTAE